MTGRTPWAEWFAFAVGGLRLSPEIFWRLSLWEWLALIAARAGETPTRAELDALLQNEGGGNRESPIGNRT